MGEKVLGFKEKDASLENPGIWIIRMEKLVPVVSVEELINDIKAVENAGSWQAFKAFAEKYKKQSQAGVEK